MVLGRETPFLVIVFSVPFLGVSLAVQVKRWHDLDKSGWMVLILFIPIVGAVCSLVVLGFRRGTVGANRFGSDLNSVTLTKSFHLGRTEVTQGQWKAVMGTTPWKGKEFVKEGGDYPAVYMRWEDAVEFCRKLSEKEGVEYRLPTEAEWEYACRAGTTTMWSFGDDESQLGEYAWYDKNADDIGEEYAHVVGQKKRNPWGLYDIHGNVFEWCQDWVGEYPSGDVTDPVGPASGSFRVYRGGSWSYNARVCRSADRRVLTPFLRISDLGFRVLRSSAK
jgi:formylglycine-generating enzyme required for sulfatase activity